MQLLTELKIELRRKRKSKLSIIIKYLDLGSIYFLDLKQKRKMQLLLRREILLFVPQDVVQKYLKNGFKGWIRYGDTFL